MIDTDRHDDDDGESGWNPCHGAHVLVVDDDDDLRQLLAQRLRELGCSTSAAPSGTAALDLLRAGSGPRVDLVVVDLRMPGISGLDVLRRVLLDGRETAAILMTGFADDDVRVNALAIGVHVLEKPFTFETLRRAVTLLLVSKRSERRRDRAFASPARTVATVIPPNLRGRLVAG